MAISSHLLDIGNHSNVYSACTEIAPKWEELGLRLSVYRPSVEMISANHGKDVSDCLRRLIDVWLRRSSPDQPLPSWRRLCDALSYLDCTLSENISIQHQCGCLQCTAVEMLFQQCKELCEKMKDPVTIAEYMYTEDAFTLEQLERIKDSTGDEKKALFTALESAVSENHYNLKIFATVLLEEQDTYSIGKSLLSKYKNEKKFFQHTKAVRPTVAELCFELEELVGWENTVIHLPEMSFAEVQKVKRNEPKVDQQKQEAFGTWLSRCPGPSWSHVRDALHKAGEYNIEKKIATNHSLSLVFSEDPSRRTQDDTVVVNDTRDPQRGSHYPNLVPPTQDPALENERHFSQHTKGRLKNLSFQEGFRNVVLLLYLFWKSLDQEQVKPAEDANSTHPHQVHPRQVYPQSCGSSILDNRPILKHAVHVLRGRSAEWSVIGLELGVPPDERDGLRRDTGLSNIDRLEKVIDYWLKTECHTPVTWGGLIEILEGLSFTATVRSIQEEFLKGKRVLEAYMKT